MDAIPKNYVDLFDKKAYAHLVTLNADGSPQVTPVWFDHDGTHVRINTAVGRQKDRNMRRPSARVALSIMDRDKRETCAQVQGTVIEITEDGADAHIDALAKKYTGAERFNSPAGQRRVTYRIRIDRLSGLE